MKNKVLVLGELLIRHTPVGNMTWEQGVQTQLFFGGSEANIAVTLASLGVQTSIVSGLPANDMGRLVNQYFKQQQVQMEHIVWKGDRVGQYYATRGVGIRSGVVTYDRANSSFTKLSLADFDLAKVFAGVSHFHVSGITIALGAEIQKLTLAMLEYAKKQQITISIDLNYRGKLWDFQTAKQTMRQFLPYADICFGIEPIAAVENETAVFDHQNATSKMIEARMQLLKLEFGLTQIYHTCRNVNSMNQNTFKAYSLTGVSDFYESEQMQTFILERVGSGDAFVSGVLSGILQGLSQEDCLNLGVYLATLKCTEYGDHLKTNPYIIKQFLAKEHQGIQR